MKIVRIILIYTFILLQVSPSVAQCNLKEFNRIMASARTLWEKNEYEKAFNKLNAAKAVCPDSAKAVDAQYTLFNLHITNQNINLINQRKQLLRKQLELEAQKVETQNRANDLDYALALNRSLLEESQKQANALAKSLETVKLARSKANALSEVNRLNAKDSYMDFLQSIKDGRKLNLYLLTIGIDKYEKIPFSLKGCVNDAKTVDTLFRRQKGILFDTIIGASLHDSMATRENILNTLKGMAMKAKRNDLFVIHFSGSGSVKDGGIVPFDGIFEKGQVNNFVSPKAACDILLNCAANILFIFDANNGDLFFKPIIRANESLNPKLLRNKIMVLGASSKGEEAHEKRIDNISHGILTHALTYGMLQKQADLDNNEVVYLDELFSYAKDFVLQQQEKQTPFILIPQAIQNFPLYQLDSVFELPAKELDLSEVMQFEYALMSDKILDFEQFQSQKLSFEDSLKVFLHNASHTSDINQKAQEYEFIANLLQSPPIYTQFDNIIRDSFYSISRYFFDNRDYKKSEKYTRLARAYRFGNIKVQQRESAWLLAHSVLLQNRYNEAKIKYLNLGDTEGVIEQINNLQKSGIKNANLERLKIEFEKLIIRQKQEEEKKSQKIESIWTWADSLQTQIAESEDTISILKLYTLISDSLSRFYLKHPADETIKSKLIAYLSEKANFAIYAKQYSVAEKAILQILNIDSTQTHVKATLADALLLQNKYEAAKKIYAESLEKGAVYTRFVELREMGIQHPDFERVVKDLQLKENEDEADDDNTFLSIEDTIDSIVGLNDTARIYHIFSLKVDSLKTVYEKDTLNQNIKNDLMQLLSQKIEYAFYLRKFKEVEESVTYGLYLDPLKRNTDYLSNYYLYSGHAFLLQNQADKAIIAYKKSTSLQLASNPRPTNIIYSMNKDIDKLAKSTFNKNIIEKIKKDLMFDIYEKFKKGQFKDFSECDSLFQLVNFKRKADTTDLFLQELYTNLSPIYFNTALFYKEYEKAEWAIREEIKYYDEEFPLKLAKALMFQHKISEATPIYLQYADNIENLDEVIDALRYLEMEGISANIIEPLVKKLIQSLK